LVIFFHSSGIAIVITAVIFIVIVIIITISAIQVQGDLQLAKATARERDLRITRRRFATDRTIAGLVSEADLRRQQQVGWLNLGQQ
jgi:uncharacterized membrane protein